MKRKTKLKGFTLIEMMIVLVIVGILAVVLMESYITISRTALRIEQEKNISEESLILTQVFQAISDEATIDYEKYNIESIGLDDLGGFVDKLYLTGGQWSGTSIYTTGDGCLELDGNFLSNEDGAYPDVSEKVRNALTGCELILDQGENKTSLIPSGKVIISRVMFKVIPYNSDENYFGDENDGIVINDVHQPGFWMFLHLYAPLYQPTGTNKIDQPLQLFFNLNL